MIAALTLSAAAEAKTYRPNKLGDHAPNGCTRSDCTLREAVIKANLRAGGDVIVLQGGKTYRRSSIGTGETDSLDGDLNVHDPLTIKSSNRRLATIDARLNEPVMDADDPLRLVRLKIQRGDTLSGSGGVSAVDDLVVKRSVFTGNTGVNGGAIQSFSGSRLVVSRSKLLRNEGLSHGGAISSSGEARISKSTIAGNRSGQSAGGVENFNGSLTVVASTISGNETEGAGGGIDNTTTGGTLRVTNSTIAGNRSAGSGGGIFTDATVSPLLNAVTIVRNRADSDNNGFGGGGGMANLEVVAPIVQNSLLALNATGSAGGPDCLNDYFSEGNNLIADTDDCNGFSDGDLVDLTPAQVKIGQLRRNGGPTKTVALRDGSRAINKAGSDAPNRDQRGERRRNPDIGAFERTRSD